MNLSRVLVRPMITEKSTLLNEQGRYVFEIAIGATKADVALAVSKAFNVTVTSVNTMNVRGKMKRFGRKVTKQPDTRKAIVALKPGDKIQLFEGA
ncbi:MAG: 50S ribosomal protein L23 [Dehalococcoidia bacterium]|nr:50S ribosomal protein L23 [Dehalococcoidia bacterium]